MAKGIIYLMSTAVPGLIKIGKTTMANYSQRMYNLESNGYRNVSSLKRAFAIEVEGYDEKELLLHTIFEKSRVADTELFAIDVNVVIQLPLKVLWCSQYQKLSRKFLKLRRRILRAG